MECAVVVMGRRPIPGAVKTRLCGVLSPDAVARLYAAFLLDTFRVVARAAPKCCNLVFSCADLDAEEASGAQGLTPPGWRVLAQPEGDLGVRMEAAREAAGARRVVIVGSDIPTLSEVAVRSAIETLFRDGSPKASAGEVRRLVLGPSLDGGFYLIGATSTLEPLFVGVPWSTPRVLDVTRRNARAHGFELTEVRPAQDVDNLADLVAVAADLEEGSATLSTLRALATAGLLEGAGLEALAEVGHIG